MLITMLITFLHFIKSSNYLSLQDKMVKITNEIKQKENKLNELYFQEDNLKHEEKEQKKKELGDQIKAIEKEKRDLETEKEKIAQEMRQNK